MICLHGRMLNLDVVRVPDLRSSALSRYKVGVRLTEPMGTGPSSSHIVSSLHELLSDIGYLIGASLIDMDSLRTISAATE